MSSRHAVAEVPDLIAYLFENAAYTDVQRSHLAGVIVTSLSRSQIALAIGEHIQQSMEAAYALATCTMQAALDTYEIEKSKISAIENMVGQLTGGPFVMDFATKGTTMNTLAERLYANDSWLALYGGDLLQQDQIYAATWKMRPGLRGCSYPDRQEALTLPGEILQFSMN